MRKQAKTQSVNVTPEKSQEYHQNPDGSWEGFLDADTANKMIKQCLDRGVLAAQKAFQKKEEMIREAIQNERESAESSGTIRTGE